MKKTKASPEVIAFLKSIARNGGKARAKKLSKKRMKEIAIMGNRARNKRS